MAGTKIGKNNKSAIFIFNYYSNFPTNESENVFQIGCAIELNFTQFRNKKKIPDT